MLPGRSHPQPTHAALSLGHDRCGVGGHRAGVAYPGLAVRAWWGPGEHCRRDVVDVVRYLVVPDERGGGDLVHRDLAGLAELERQTVITSCARSTSARSSAIASPVRRPVTAISPISVSKVTARSGEGRLRAAVIRAVICSAESRYCVVLDAWLGTRPFGGTSVSLRRAAGSRR